MSGRYECRIVSSFAEEIVSTRQNYSITCRVVRIDGCEQSTGLPQGREPYGDGASIVVRGRESRPHGHRGEKEAQRRSEAGFPWKGRKGTRDAHSRNDPEHYPRPR